MKSVEELRGELRYRLVERYERLITLGMLEVAYGVLRAIEELEGEGSPAPAKVDRLVHLSELEGRLDPGLSECVLPEACRGAQSCVYGCPHDEKGAGSR